jgi:uroporphyrin-III C-methyltransferase
VTDDSNAPVPLGNVPAAAAAPPPRAWWLALAVLGALTIASLVLAWRAEQRGAGLEHELVRRQQDSAVQVTEARMLAKQAHEGMSEAAAKVALLEARVAEVAVQRGQLEELIQSLSRSRDENLVVDVEAAIRVALQQAAITGSAEPLVATLKQSEERLARYNQPRLEGVRRAIGRDLDRVKAASVADIASLGIKLDEAIRMVDELPLLAVAEPRRDAGRTAAAAPAAASGVAAPSASAVWAGKIGDAWSAIGERVWGEVRALVRVTRIDHPDAVLLAPEQSFFVRENLKLRLLNARLALLSRQFDIAQSDLRAAQLALDRYFDRGAKRTALAGELIRQVVAQARQVGVPRPDETLAALTAAAGR